MGVEPQRPPRLNADSIPDGDESVTAQAPGLLTDMLRVMATPEDEVEPENQTAVMPNAPVKPPSAHQSSKSRVATHSEISEAESGLAMAIPDRTNPERASVGALLADAPVARASLSTADGVQVPGVRGSLASFPSSPPVPKKPRYGLVVGLVAGVSFAIPLALFLWLHQSAPAAAPRAPSEVVPDLVARGDAVRPRSPKVVPAPASTPRPSPPNRWVRHR
jgi:hypothetical protein